MCVCVCLCVCTRVRVCMCVCVRACVRLCVITPRHVAHTRTVQSSKARKRLPSEPILDVPHLPSPKKSSLPTSVDVFTTSLANVLTQVCVCVCVCACVRACVRACVNPFPFTPLSQSEETWLSAEKAPP